MRGGRKGVAIFVNMHVKVTLASAGMLEWGSQPRVAVSGGTNEKFEWGQQVDTGVTTTIILIMVNTHDILTIFK